MEIGPVRSDHPSSGRAETEKTKNNCEPKAASAVDRIEISNEARMRLAALADRALKAASQAHRQTDSQSLQKSLEQHDDKTDKLAQARDRIESGFYDREDVRQKIAERLAAVLEEHRGKVNQDEI